MFSLVVVRVFVVKSVAPDATILVAEPPYVAELTTYLFVPVFRNNDSDATNRPPFVVDT
jgi:hypothetical protein